jgi:nucleoside phosphorylase
METMNIILFVFDTKVNFEKSKKNLGSEGSSFKKIICVEDEIEFEKEFQLLQETELVFMVVHVFYTDSINGIKRFVASRIDKKYPNLGFMFISEGDSKEINKQMIDAEFQNKPVYKYHQVQSNLEEERAKVYSKKEIIQLANSNPSLSGNRDSSVLSRGYPQCDYAIITALEEDEMTKILPMIKKEGETANTKHLIEYGHLIKNPNKKIAYASQQSTGMIDAAILATELLTLFNPKFLIMLGVLGGKPNEVNIGDIIVSTKVFTIDKGKLTTEEILKDESVKEQIDIVEKEEEEIKKVFKKEIESVTMNSSAITKFIRKKADILSYINSEDQTRNKNINLLFGPIACVRQVIDQKGYFEENILVIDRKAIGLEMESYSVARACELVNNGATTPIIVKSVMDNTADKVDEAKPYAAWTSAMFVKYILENDMI